MAVIRVGFSGWTYAPWRGVFYPSKLAQRQELSFASRQVPSIEINGTFYRLQKPETFRQWYDQAPDDFRFAVKATQYITHRLRLKDAAQPLANFFASGLLCLKDKLGPILWQLPPNLPYADERLLAFLKLLPDSSAAAGALAERHDHFVDGRCHLEPGGVYPVRHAFEFRHKSFCDLEVLTELRRLQIGLVVADAGEHAIGAEDVTSDFVYVRMHGQDPAYEADGYTDDALRRMARKLKVWCAGGSPEDSRCLLPPPAVRPRDVYVYFDNDAKAHAPRDAMRLIAMLADA